MTQTDRLGLPLLAAGQAQKEVTHNEALSLIDLLAQPATESADLSTPPGSPEPGRCWIVASGASGAWAGRDDDLAGWSAAGWLFATPQPGWRVWVQDRGNMMRFDGNDWIDEAARSDGFYLDSERIVGIQQAAIADPAGGATQDDEARAAITAVLDAMRAHGLIAI